MHQINGIGCKNFINNTKICPLCPEFVENGKCECISVANGLTCVIINVIGGVIKSSVQSLKPDLLIIVVTVIGSLFGLCI